MTHTDAIGREINLGDPVFYNGNMYSVEGFKPKSKQVKLQYLGGTYRLQTPKEKYCSEVILIDPAAVTAWLLTRK